MKQLFPAIRLLLIMTVLTGVIYPLTMTALGGVLFPTQANGSLITQDGAIVGSALIGQANEDARYFWSRPSAVNYLQSGSPLSGGANLSVINPTLREQVAARAAAIREAHGLAPDATIPNDLITASASGLDPHISVAAAELQIDRVATARGVDREAIAALVQRFTEGRQLGFLGEARVNVLQLNLALDQQ
ncbi:MAG: K(+)-transporting ATPase subunit C [Anaerolineae bacterium]|nr:K(+)-transporting ATPase subunit C [Anaerolineae bacterium]